MKQLKSLKRDGKGYLYRNLGWLSRNGRDKPSQPKFLLGHDEGLALDRLRRLERLWSLIEQRHRAEPLSGQPTWDRITLAIGKAISRGEHTFHLARQNQPDTREDGAAWADADYAGYLRSLQEMYPVITFVPAETEAFQNGIRKNIEIAESHQSLADDFAKDAGQRTVRDLNETLHKAIKAYVAAIDQDPRFQTHESSPGAQPLTAFGYKLKSTCLDFVNRYADRPLSTMSSLESVQELYDFWRNRPKRKGTDQPIRIDTVKHRLTALNQFLKWLHKSDQFSWRKPLDFDEIDQSVKETKQERSEKARADQVTTFSEEDLVAIYKNTTTPLERLLLLLGLNCGCKQAEVGTIALGDVFLESPHPHADVLGYHTTATDSFIKRMRLKTGVYGEFKLWPHTVLGLKWLVARRERQTHVRSGKHAGAPIPMKPSSVLLTTEAGLPLYRLYESGNTSQDIPKCWARVVKRAMAVSPQVPQLSYSTLRRTASNFLRKTYGGEVASVFLQHGSPFEKDRLLEEYSNRPFGRLFEALDRLGERLRPMFDMFMIRSPQSPCCRRTGRMGVPMLVSQGSRKSSGCSPKEGRSPKSRRSSEFIPRLSTGIGDDW